MVREGWLTLPPEIRDAMKVVTSVLTPLTSFSHLTEVAEGLALMMEHTRVTELPLMPEYVDDPTCTVGKAARKKIKKTLQFLNKIILCLYFSEKKGLKAPAFLQVFGPTCG